eukprot:snap_masked-scaffold_4-processed-gene-7.53-mRNA-1 protein AED:1.00 eAED:1.00 QI:0/0/0/0/1/1/2/0/302
MKALLIIIFLICSPATCQYNRLLDLLIPSGEKTQHALYKGELTSARAFIFQLRPLSEDMRWSFKLTLDFAEIEEQEEEERFFNPMENKIYLQICGGNSSGIHLPRRPYEGNIFQNMTDSCRARFEQNVYKLHGLIQLFLGKECFIAKVVSLGKNEVENLTLEGTTTKPNLHFRLLTCDETLFTTMHIKTEVTQIFERDDFVAVTRLDLNLFITGLDRSLPEIHKPVRSRSAISLFIDLNFESDLAFCALIITCNSTFVQRDTNKFNLGGLSSSSGFAVSQNVFFLRSSSLDTWMGINLFQNK